MENVVELRVGGYNQTEITEEVKALVDSQVGNINAALGTHYTSFTINQAERQAVAGRQYVVQLTSNDGTPVTAQIFQAPPYDNPAEV